MNFKFLYFFTIISIFIFEIESKKVLNKLKKTINLAFPVTNKYINFLYIALISLLENSDKNTIYNIIIQYGNSNLNKENSILILQLEQIYFNCFIHIIDMKYDFYGTIQGALDLSAYYRLKLPILCQGLNRIIHLDSDILILKDLMGLYTLNFNGKYLLGRLDTLADELDSLGIQTKTYINTGVLLFDLYNLRKYNYTEKFIEYTKNNNNETYLIHHDQTLINYICYDKIGILKPKYHMWPFRNKKDILTANKALRTPYNKNEFIKDFYDPVVVHFPGKYKNCIKEKGRLYHEKYFEYSILAEERKKNIKYSSFEIFKKYIAHYVQKIKCRYNEDN